MYPVNPPEACENHDGQSKISCDECERDRSYYEDLAADAAYERWRLGE